MFSKRCDESCMEFCSVCFLLIIFLAFLTQLHLNYLRQHYVESQRGICFFYCIDVQWFTLKKVGKNIKESFNFNEISDTRAFELLITNLDHIKQNKKVTKELFLLLNFYNYAKEFQIDQLSLKFLPLPTLSEKHQSRIKQDTLLKGVLVDNFKLLYRK